MISEIIFFITFNKSYDKLEDHLYIKEKKKILEMHFQWGIVKKQSGHCKLYKGGENSYTVVLNGGKGKKYVIKNYITWNKKRLLSSLEDCGGKG